MATLTGKGCPNCKSTDIKTDIVDERSRYRCLTCRNYWYGARGWSSAKYTVLDRIADDVVNQGSCEITASSLINGAFPDLKQKFSEWLASHGFRSETFYRSNPHSQRQAQYVIIRRK